MLVLYPSWVKPTTTIVASLIVSLDLLSLLLVNHSSGTHFVGTLDSADCNDTITLSTTTLYPNIHNASILCGTA